MLMQDILIIGSSGYIGNALTQYLQDLNYNITTVDYDATGNPIYVTDYKLLDRDFYKKFTHIILLAGHSSLEMCNDDYENAWNNNVINFADLINKLTENQVLIYASSDTVYGYGYEYKVENTKLPNPYHNCDVINQIVEKIATGAKCRTIGLRLANVNGYTERAKKNAIVNSLIIDAKTNNSINCTNGSNYKNILGINDCTRAIETIIKTTDYSRLEQHEIFNLVSFDGLLKNSAKIIGKLLTTTVNYSDTITNLVSYQTSNTKFNLTFNFQFHDTIEGIVNSFENNIPVVENKPILSDATPEVTIVRATAITVEPEVENPDDKIENFGVVFDTIIEEPVTVETHKSPTFRELAIATPEPEIVSDIVEGQHYTRLYSCLCCNNSHLFVILDLGKQPLAIDNNVEHYDLLIMGCDQCWHSQLNVIVDRDILFKKYPAIKPTQFLQDYYDMVAVDCTTRNLGPGKVLDIGCNNGLLLDSFKNNNWLTFGVDPSEKLHAVSTNKGHTVFCEYWNYALACNLPKFDIIYAKDVFDYTTNLNEFLDSCTKIMHNGTLLIIECQSDMFEKNQHDIISHEQVSYFSIKSMVQIVESTGLFVDDVKKINAGNEYRYKFEIHKTDPRHPVPKLAEENYRYNREFYDNYRENVLKNLNDL